MAEFSSVRDINFLQALMLTFVLTKPFAFETAEIQQVADSFFANFRRALACGEVVTEVAVLSTMIQMSLDATVHESGISLDEIPDDATTKAFVEQGMDKLLLLLREARSDPAKYWMTARRTFDSVFPSLPDTRAGLLVVLEAMTANAWTAFESAATDLWVAAVNARPELLGKAALSNAHTLPNSDRSSKPVTTFISTLIGLKHPIPAGNLIMESERFNFNRLEGIKAAYETTFGSHTKAVFEAEAFNDLIVLEGVRNVLVHRAGIADAQYRKRIEESRKAYEKLGLSDAVEGQPINLDGDVVNAFLISVAMLTESLFGSMDSWLTSHPS